MNLVSAQTKQVPISVTLTQNHQDTVLQATSIFTSYSDSEIAAKMKDTAYLRNISGEYWISNIAGKAITIEVIKSKTLLINLPGRGRYELLPITPIYFNVKDLPGVEILIFTDRFDQVRALNVIDKQEPKNSPQGQIMANKQGQFRN